MKKLIGFIILTLSLSSFNHGSWVAILKCESKENNSQFYAELRDIEVRLEKAVLKINDKKLEYGINNDDIIFAPKKGILTFNINSCKNKASNCLTFNSIPSTFIIEKSESRHEIYKFKAKIEGLKKEDGKENNIIFDCRLEYII